MLTAEEEKELAEKLHYRGDLEAAKTLILSHLRFVVHVARNYAGYGLPQADLIQEGNIGLMKAVRRFNPEVGVRLVSFAVHWIKAEIHEYVLRNWRIVKVATTKAQRKLFFNLRKTKQRLGWFNQDEVEMVARELGVSSKDVREMESRMAAQDMTFDMSADDDASDSQPMAPVLYLQDKTSNFADGIEEDNWEDRAANKLTFAMEGLDERSRDIIRARWLDEDNKSTLQELADRYGVSAERVRQLEKNAMKNFAPLSKRNFLEVHREPPDESLGVLFFSARSGEFLPRQTLTDALSRRLSEGDRVKNNELNDRRLQATPRGIGVMCNFYADKAENATVWDVEGNEYIDFAAGIAVLNTGHRHPKVIAAIEKQLHAFTHTAYQIVPYEGYVALAERINQRVPIEGPAKTAFFSTGAEAVENAVKIARAYTSRPGLITFGGAFHGRTFMTMALTGKVAPYKLGFGPFPGSVYHAQFPNNLHGVSTAEALKARSASSKPISRPIRWRQSLLNRFRARAGSTSRPLILCRRCVPCAIPTGFY